MIVEMRTYTLALGATGRYFKLYAEKGLGVQKRILGHLVGYYAVEVGELNKVVHLWAYDSLDERAKRRAALWADNEWLAYVAEVGLGLALAWLLEGTAMVEAPERAESVPFYRQAEMRQVRERLVQAVDALPAQERTVIRSHYLQGRDRLCSCP